MPNQLSFHLPYKSISSFSDVEVPDFCLVTGKNGSGKSHLLEAIERGSVKTSLTDNPNAEIARFDSDSIVPKDTGNFSPAQASMQENQKFIQITQNRQQVITNAQNTFSSWGLDPSKVINMDDVLLLADEATFQAAFPQHPKQANLYTSYKQQISSWAANVVQIQGQNDKLGQNLKKLAQTEPALLLAGRESEIFRHEIFEKTNVGTFQQAFGKVFTDYRKKLIANVAKKLGNNEQSVLSDEQFFAHYGPKPWDFVNEILEVSNLDFRINHPALDDPYGSFETRLTKVSTGVEMMFADLSSGERVLMSFALCLYNSSEKKDAAAFPKLLLLDEVDAPLHPDMVKFILKTIREVLVEKHQISVIATTHSPTTVALFDDQGIFEMKPDGPSLEKISKDHALSILTAGVPTVSVSYNQINQIFVESETDAIVLSELYQIFKSSLSTERSVQFIKSGRKKDTGSEENAGCARVKSVVQDLRDAGVNTVFGLIDWDGKHTSEDGIVVLCESTRYSIENLILDPVIVIATLAKEFTEYAKKNEFLNESETFVEMATWDERRWQTAVDLLMQTVGMLAEEKTNVGYRSGMNLSFARSYLEMRGHDLVKLVCAKIPPFDGRLKQGNLEASIARNVIPEIKSLIPCEMLGVFEELTAKGPH
ncbi:putative ATPase [Labrenzia sp. EL_159]|nr:putative ATPase [Labrenzia sp. EL_162]MBG6196629.1 putative ATPase [Labrenzia sp. EL_159]